MKKKLLHGDCIEQMSRLPDNCIDLVLTDPPYGTTQNKWDSIIPLDQMWKELKRVTRPESAIVIMAMQPFTSAVVMSNPCMFKYEWVWQKSKGTGHLNAKRQPMRNKEDILVFYQKQCNYFPQMTVGTPYKNKAGKDHTSTSSMTDSYGEYSNFRNENTGFRYPKQILEIASVERNSVHPTQKPVALMEYLIKTYTKEKEIVLDFTMGSGTTGVACKNLNRSFVGIELNSDYFNLATKRIEDGEIIE